jgi:hypothetical protein
LFDVIQGESNLTKLNICKNELELIINKCLDRLYQDDRYLIINTPADWDNYKGDPDGGKDGHVGERAIVFRFGLYLWNELRDHAELKQLNLDCEYNRNFYDSKSFMGFDNGSYPDLIIHKRGSNGENIIVIEFKTWWNSDRTKDIQKIRGLMDISNNYQYKFGVSILLAKKRKQCNLEWVQAI